MAVRIQFNPRNSDGPIQTTRTGCGHLVVLGYVTLYSKLHCNATSLMESSWILPQRHITPRVLELSNSYRQSFTVKWILFMSFPQCLSN
jgi:hypothetical protein